MPKKGWPHKRTIVYTPRPRIKKTRRFHVFSIIGKALRRTATVIGSLILFSVFMSVLLMIMVANESQKLALPEHMVLVFRMDEEIPEKEENSAFSGAFGLSTPSVRQIVNAIDYAGQDERVKGLVFSFRDGGALSLAHTEEIRAAVLRFKKSGKFTKAYSTSFESGAGGLGRYYLASVFDDIIMQPMGTLAIGGIYAEMPFMGDLLERFGVKAQFFQRKEYKTAMENFTASSMSKENREELEDMLGTIFDYLVSGISVARHIPKEDLTALIDQGMFTGKEALSAELIDRLEYSDVITDEIKIKESNGLEDEDALQFLLLKKYASAIKDNPPPAFQHKSKAQVAVVYVEGAIVDSAESGSPMGGEPAGADDISEALLSAAEDDNIKAVVLRVNSPGGSPVASETIRRAVLKVKKAGKPMIVSMGDMAASGGYWISTDADYIFALPQTLTGSIGVVGGKFVLDGVWNKLDVNWDTVQFGKNAGLMSMNSTFSPMEQERFEAMLDDIYDGFIERVSKGRGLSLAETEKIAKGRVWVGLRAKDHKLIDAYGGLDSALDYVAAKIGKKNRFDLNVVTLPRSKSPLEQFINLLEGQVRAGQFMQNQAAIYEVLSPFAEHIIQARQIEGGATYEMPVTIK